MSDQVRLACKSDVVEISLDKILPIRRLDDGIRKTVKYRCIESSIRELGLIEPLVIFPHAKSNGAFILLDGHVRLMILKALGLPSAKCLIATDDEGFTYNHKVSRLSAIQEHFMILRATKNGVTEDRIARALNVDIQSIRQKRDLLEGICAEAVVLLRDRRVPGNSLRELRKVKSMRQIEIGELMCAASNFSIGYAKCLVAATPAEQLVEAGRAKDIRGLSPEDISRMEHEMDSLGREFKLIEESHGKNVLNLVLVVGYLRKLTENTRIVRFLSQRHAEILCEFQKLVESRSLGDGVPASDASD
jgi:hypothetical protein